MRKGFDSLIGDAAHRTWAKGLDRGHAAEDLAKKNRLRGHPFVLGNPVKNPVHGSCNQDR